MQLEELKTCIKKQQIPLLLYLHGDNTRLIDETISALISGLFPAKIKSCC